MVLDKSRGSEAPKSKRRRIQGSCDVCKTRKMRCDSAETPDNRCTNCKNSGLDCTHADITKAIMSAKGYVSALESRVEKMESLLSKLLPGIDFITQLDNDTDVEPLVQHVETLPRNDADELSGNLRKLQLNPEENRFFGKSSGIRLLQTALDFRSRSASLPQTPRSIVPDKRKEFWEPPRWLLPVNDRPQYKFPDPDLLPVLVNLYFQEVNRFSPVLHRPTFDRKVAAKLHLIDHRFAATLLMVCSLGARYSDDSRTLLEGQSTYTSAGWKWHSQVRVIPDDLIYKPDLYELQTIALSAMYLLALSPTSLAWNQIGFGLRRAQDVGAHRRRLETHPTAENEQWKRVFWVLLCLEWVFGTLTGRPLAMRHQDFDQDIPIECDDEYWDVPRPLKFKQPKDRPSVIAYFNCHIKLLEVQAAVTTALYSPRKPNNLGGHPLLPTDAQTITHFDSALNSWLSRIPDHLRWDPERKDTLHFNQSALLFAAYYNVQILVHRPFIPPPLEISPPGTLPSLAICANAARSCARIFEAHDRRGIPLNPNLLPMGFITGVVLLLNAWCSRRPGSTATPPKDLDLITKCLKPMMEAEMRYPGAGRFNDVLIRLMRPGESLDSLFRDLKQIPVAPPSTQNAYASPLAPDGFDDYRLPGGLDIDTVFDFEQLMNMDLPSLSAEIPVDTDITSMWSTTSADDWSHIMTEGPQLVVEENPGPRIQERKLETNHYFTCV